MHLKTSLVLCLASAILLILCFSGPHLAILAWGGLVPFLMAIDKKGPKKAFFLSWFTGTIFFLGILYWLIYVTLAGLVILALYLGLYFAFFGLLVSGCEKREVRKICFLSSVFCPLLSVIRIPCLWVALEFLRSHLFTGFGWALLGYSQYRNLPVVQISDITGSYGVSFLIVLVNVALWQVMAYIKEKRAKENIALIFFAICCLAGSLFYGSFRLNQKIEGEKIDISVVQGNIAQVLKWDIESKLFILERYSRLTRLAGPESPRMIIWPETSFPGYLEEERELLDKVSELAREIDIPLLIGAPTTSQYEYFNSAVLLSAKGEETARYDKLRLVPFGEYVPCESVFGFARNVFDQIADFSPGSEYTIFTIPKDRRPETGDRRPATFAVLICFEDLFPDLVRRFVREGAGFMVNMTNDSMFGKSTAPYQHAMASVFRAVENRVSVVRSANTGLSCFINSRGKIENRASNREGEDIFITAHKTAKVTTSAIPTFYTRYGDMFAVFCIIISLASLALYLPFPPRRWKW